MSKYLITLTPTGKFFFGGDMTFQVGDKANDDFNSQFSSYIIKSNKFPQQTSLLGMLRFLILRNDSEIFDETAQTIRKEKRGEAEDLIGKESFKIDKKVTFGKIDAIHPCFLQVNKGTKWTDLIQAPKADYFSVDFSKFTTAKLNGNDIEIPQMNYDSKDYYEQQYKCAACGQMTKESDIFQEDMRLGIDRNIKDGKTEEGALYKQICYRLKEGYRFAFYADVDDDVKLSAYDGQIVTIGGDSSQFIVGIEKSESAKEDVDGKGKTVVLKSPAYVTTEEMAKVRYAITETIPFKCMATKTADVQSYNRQNKQYDYSRKLNLFNTGSVFYFKTEEDVSEFVKTLKETHANFYKIGYNHYTIK